RIPRLLPLIDTARAGRIGPVVLPPRAGFETIRTGWPSWARFRAVHDGRRNLGRPAPPSRTAPGPQQPRGTGRKSTGGGSPAYLSTGLRRLLVMRCSLS